MSKSAAAGSLEDAPIGDFDSWVENCAGMLGPASYTGLGENEMLESNPKARIVLTTESTLEEANKLGRTLVEERLVACATLLPVVQSIYYWKDHIHSAPETMVMLKTSAEKLEALEARMRELHSYRVPEFLVIPVEMGTKLYLDWLAGTLAEPR
jgi:periplasmic divalent cation tolerance protein